MNDEFKLLGHRFDTVQFSLKVRVPDALTDVLLAAQKTAKESRKPEPVELGRSGRVAGEVLRHGGGGGDAIFSTGELGEMWFFKTAQREDDWGVTIKLGSLALLCHTFDDALARAWDRARDLGLEAAKGYSLGRIDYRFDFLTPREFAPVERCLIRPNRASVRPFEVLQRGHPLFYDIDDTDIRRVLRGTRIETLMVGKIGSGQQVVLYDKRAEQIAKRQRVLFESYQLEDTSGDWGLWRAEIRYAGDVLKRRWKTKSLPALRAKLQPMLNRAITRIRYVQRDQDSIPTPRRVLHSMWEQISDAIPGIAFSDPPHFAPDRAAYLLEAERKASLKAGMTGCALSLAAMQARDETALHELAPRLAHSIVSGALKADPEKVRRALRHAWRAHLN